jgi:hypothetical protein
MMNALKTQVTDNCKNFKFNSIKLKFLNYRVRKIESSVHTGKQRGLKN